MCTVQDEDAYKVGMRVRDPEKRLRHFLRLCAGKKMDERSGNPQPTYKLEGMKVGSLGLGMAGPCRGWCTCRRMDCRVCRMTVLGMGDPSGGMLHAMACMRLACM